MCNQTEQNQVFYSLFLMQLCLKGFWLAWTTFLSPRVRLMRKKRY